MSRKTKRSEEAGAPSAEPAAAPGERKTKKARADPADATTATPCWMVKPKTFEQLKADVEALQKAEPAGKKPRDYMLPLSIDSLSLNDVEERLEEEPEYVDKLPTAREIVDSFGFIGIKKSFTKRITDEMKFFAMQLGDEDELGNTGDGTDRVQLFQNYVRMVRAKLNAAKVAGTDKAIAEAFAEFVCMWMKMAHGPYGDYWIADNEMPDETAKIFETTETMFRLFANSFTEKQLDIAAGGCQALHATADRLRKHLAGFDFLEIEWGEKDVKL